MLITRKVGEIRGLFALLAMSSSAALAGAETASPTPTPTPTPTAEELTPGIWLIPGTILPDREPDGNTIIFKAPAGLIVMDTGRHEWHRRALLTLAERERQPIIAIVNSHWHLDHVSGNPALRARYPDLRVYASNAIDRALAGFLAESEKNMPRYLQDQTLPASEREDIAGDLATIENGAALRPDVVITPFRLAVPGHGAPMKPAQFARYRRAFDSFIDGRRLRRSAASRRRQDQVLREPRLLSTVLKSKPRAPTQFAGARRFPVNFEGSCHL